MAIDNTFTKKRVEKMKHLFVLFSAATRLPFVECDDKTFDDQIYAFTTEKMTQEFAKGYTAKKIPLQAVRIDTPMFKGFFESLYQYGITAVMLQEEGAPVRIPLSDLADRPEISTEEMKTLPVSNPALQLTGMYFMQMIRRPVKERDKEDLQEIRVLEEELAHNLFRSRFIVSFDTSRVQGEWNPKDKTAQVGVPLINTKEGKAFQPVFTEIAEFRRFSARNKEKRKMRLIPVPYQDLHRFLVKNSEGFIFNPAGFNLVLTRAQMERLQKQYGEE